ncbi:MAG: YwbE family protein [Methanomicrobiales archaeon]
MNDHSSAARRDGRVRAGISRGDLVDIVRKTDQKSGRLTRGRVQEILTRSATHPHGIKVRLTDGSVGRVHRCLGTDSPGDHS